MSDKQNAEMNDKEVTEKVTMTLKLLQWLGNNPIKLCLFLIILTASCFLVTGCVTLGFKDDERLLLYHDNAVEWEDLKNHNGLRNQESNVGVK